MPANRSPLHTIHTDTTFQPSLVADAKPADQFPNSRYFQVHFQHLHESNQQLQNQMRHLEHCLAHLNFNLEHLTILLSGTNDSQMQ